MLAVEIEGLSKSYKGTQALKDIKLKVEEGEIFGVIGPDGAGKTTLMKIMAGILSFDEGEVRIFGKDVKSQPEAVKSFISFLPQGIGQSLYMDLTVEENIDFHIGIKGLSPEKLEDLKEKLLSMAGLLEFRNRRAKHLSGGMQQKLGICCSLVVKPKLIILDEPTTGVDPVSRRELWDILFEFSKEGTTIVLSTSYMTEAERCHRVALMDRGKIITKLDTDEVVDTGTDFEDVFKKFSKSEGFRVILPSAGKRKGFSISVNRLTKKFGDFTAVSEVSFHVKESEIFGLLGPNGAGKTTTIKIMVGLLKPTKGSVVMPDRREIGYMSQKFSLYRDLTVEENIDYYASLYGMRGKEKEARKGWILEMSELKNYRKELVDNLPLGFRQRLALGCSFIHFPKVLFLDEPTSGVDPSAREGFWKLITSLSRDMKTTTLVTTHHLKEAHYCDRLALMNTGKIIAEGSPEDLIEIASQKQGDIYEIKTSDIFKARDLLKNNGYYVYPYGKRLRVWTKRNEREIKHLLGEAVIEKKRPNMEDVFVFFSSETSLVDRS